MLYIKGVKYDQQFKMDDVILHPDIEFNAFCAHGDCEWWVNTEFSRELITCVDRIDVRDTTHDTKMLLLFQGVRLEDLATGTKNVILFRYKDWGEKVYGRMGFMGENCFKYLVQAALEKDIYMVTTVYRRYPRQDAFPDNGCVCFEDIGSVAKSELEWRKCMLELVTRGIVEA